MISTEAFVSALRSIADSRPVYRTGGDGSDGTCDCIGLIMGAMYRCGRSAYDMHSSNYFARFQTENLHALEGVQELNAGDVVYKARAGKERLHERYLPGGRYDNGDPLDYYHAGVVISTQPLCILHCTSGGGVNGIAQDTTLGEWSHSGCVCGVETAQTVCRAAFVYAEKGKTVNLRIRPDETSPVLARIPVGRQVQIAETADGWAKIRLGGQTGYMMMDYLKENEQDTVSIPRQTLRMIADTLARWL